MKDEIVEKLHKIRKESAEEFNFDVDAIFEDLREKQNRQVKSGRKVVSFINKKTSNEDDKIAA